MNPHPYNKIAPALMAVALAITGCASSGPTTTEIDFSERVHRDVVGEPDPTSPWISLDYDFLEIKLTDTETVTLSGRNNYIEFQLIDPDKRTQDELRELWTSEVQWVAARSAGHGPEEAKSLLRERAELAGQTVDWGPVDEWIEGKGNPDTFDEYSRTLSVIDEWVGDDGWRLIVSLLGREPGYFTIRSSLSPRFETATKDLAPDERNSISFNPNFTRTEDLE